MRPSSPVFRVPAVAACAACLLCFATATSRAGTIVRFDTNLGSFEVELYDALVPTTVNNFLNYVTSGRYDSTLVHRSTSIPPSAVAIIQGGAYDPLFHPIVLDAPIPLEYQVPNTRGTIAMARSVLPDSANSQWFINTVDNSDVLGPQNGGGYAVFGEVLGNGMDVVDAINALPRYAAGPFPQDVPLHDYTQGVDDPLAHTVVVGRVTVVPEPATGMLALLGVAGAALLWRRARHARSRRVIDIAPGLL